MVNYSPAAGRKVKQALCGQSLQNVGLSRHCGELRRADADMRQGLIGGEA